MERKDDYPQLRQDKRNGFCRRRNGLMEFRQNLASVDASASNSSGSGTGAIKFAPVTIGSVGKGNSTIILVVLGVGVLLWFLNRPKRK
jgi:hypothetical protein